MKTAPLNIVFMGTPDFAVPSLEALAESQHNVVAVVTVPDKQQGRGRKMQPSAVKRSAAEHDIPVLQPEKLRDPAFIQDLEAFAPDLMVVVAFRILPEVIFNLPSLGTFNLHASLLPRYRGAAPIHWALLNGDDQTGVTTFFLQKKVDTGNIIQQKATDIEREDNLASLYEKLRQLGASLVVETVDLIAQGKADPSAQNDQLASPAPKVDTDTRTLNFNESATQCLNRIRAFAPRPGAFTTRNGKMLKILKARVVEAGGHPGAVHTPDHGSFTVFCSEDALDVLEVQPESKRSMSAEAYLQGHPFNDGDVLGD